MAIVTKTSIQREKLNAMADDFKAKGLDLDRYGTLMNKLRNISEHFGKEI